MRNSKNLQAYKRVCKRCLNHEIHRGSKQSIAFCRKTNNILAVVKPKMWMMLDVFPTCPYELELGLLGADVEC